MPNTSSYDLKNQASQSPNNAPGTICLTIGDSNGIGPEITAKCLHHWASLPVPHKVAVFGDIGALEENAAQLGFLLPEGELFNYHNLQAESLKSKIPGAIAYQSLEAAVSEIVAGRGETLVTGPISKENLQAAKLPYSGHTEILQDLAQQYYGYAYQSDMLFLYRQFRMLLLSRHVPLRQVSDTLSIDGVTRSLSNLADFFKNYCQIQHPRLCVLGVNPHAGEIEGQEEAKILKPAIKAVSQHYGFGIEPPIAADAAFRHFDVNRLKYDAYVAAYHDQGLIPFKMVAGLNAVNVTIGLPFLRTSVSHGTAPDIAGQGLADPTSLLAAFDTAVKLAMLPITDQYPPTLKFPHCDHLRQAQNPQRQQGN